MTARPVTPTEPCEPDLTLRAEKLVGGGRALAHSEGATWMVAGALPEEKLKVRVTRRRAGIVEARTVAIEGSPHPARNTDPCPHATVCGGCDWPHVKSEEEGRLKALVAADAARNHRDLAENLVRAQIHSSPLGYRLRARLHWDPDSQQLGFFEEQSRRVTPIPDCRILTPDLMAAIPAFRAALARNCRHHVDLEWLQGSRPGDAVAGLRQAKGGPRTIAEKWIPTREEVAPHVLGFHSLDRNGEIQHGWGSPSVTIGIPRELTVPIGAFFQGNRHLLGALSQRIAVLAGGDPEPIFDLHAGVGFLAAAVLTAGDREAFLAEPHRVAARAAAENLPSARVAIGETAESFVSSQPDLPHDALAITDPPRAGLTKSLRGALVTWRPRRILMLGCDPATWARDARHLIDHGYDLRSVELFDLFPSTHHVEILALLECR